MQKWKAGLILLVICIASFWCSFYFEASYRKLIRYLYVVLSNGRISFFTPKKSLHFPSPQYVLTFGVFTTTLCMLGYRHTTRQRMIHTGLAVVLFLSLTVMLTYIGAIIAMAECTACQDGTRQLRYGDIRYDAFFIISLSAAIIPAMTTKMRKFINSGKQNQKTS